jgi:hypothetical protein
MWSLLKWKLLLLEKERKSSKMELTGVEKKVHQ